MDVYRIGVCGIDGDDHQAEYCGSEEFPNIHVRSSFKDPENIVTTAIDEDEINRFSLSCYYNYQ